MAAHLSTLPFFQASSLHSIAVQLKSAKSTFSTRSLTYASNVTYEANAQKTMLQKGVLVEFKKDSGRIVLGVTQNREGKRNWSVIDQNADTYIVKPKQINLIVPGTDNFSPQDVGLLLQEAELLQDPTLLEIAWEEMLLDDRTANIEELALILYGSTSPEKCYSAYRLLSSTPIYFKCREDGYSPIYEPRPLAQVKELQMQQVREELAQKKLLEFVEYINSVMQLPFDERPTRECWDSKDAFQAYLEPMKAFALDMCKSPEIKNAAVQVLEALKVNRTSSSALNLLGQIRYFKVHENVQLLKLNLPVGFSAEALAQVEVIKAKASYDVDKNSRVDLTGLKVYTIDCDNPDEIDDGLSAVRLPDGRLKVWIHIADPTQCIEWQSILQKEAGQRCASVYLPTLTIPMLPKDLGVDLLSLRQGKECSTVSVSVILAKDGSVAEKTIENAIVSPTYSLSYEAAAELIGLDLEEERAGLSILYQAALQRRQWRHSNGAMELFLPNVKVSVKDEAAVNPEITLCVEDQRSPAIVLVTEMMLLCGEVIAAFGDEHGLCLPYKGQTFDGDSRDNLQSIPDGPARAVTALRCTLPPEISYGQPLQHACLGLPSYVQFTSPLRRYPDLLVHYQVKAVLRNVSPPILRSHMEASMAAMSTKARMLKRLQSDSDRYWILEYLRREPAERKYSSCLLRYEKDTTAVVWLSEVGLLTSMELYTQRSIGHEFFVRVVDSQPRKNFLLLKEA